MQRTHLSFPLRKAFNELELKYPRLITSLQKFEIESSSFRANCLRPPFYLIDRSYSKNDLQKK